MKKGRKWIYLLVAVFVLIAVGFGTYKVIAGQKNGEDNAKEKAQSEIDYLEGKIVELFNNMNGIEFENYKLSVTEIKGEETKSSKGSSSDSSSSGSEGESESSGSGQGGSESSGDSSSGNQSSTSSKGGKKYILQETGVLTKSQDIDWTTVKTQVEDLYLSLPTITLDLYQTDIKKEDVLNLNTEIDNLTKEIKNENKESTLATLTKVYELIRKFTECCADESLEKSTIRAKENVLKAYSLLDSNDWPAVVQYTKQGVDEFSKIITQNQIKPEKQYAVNKGYVMLNELQKAAEQQDVQIFLIKYKNLLEDLNNL